MSDETKLIKNLTAKIEKILAENPLQKAPIQPDQPMEKISIDSKKLAEEFVGMSKLGENINFNLYFQNANTGKIFGKEFSLPEVIQQLQKTWSSKASSDAVKRVFIEKFPEATKLFSADGIKSYNENKDGVVNIISEIDKALRETSLIVEKEKVKETLPPVRPITISYPTESYQKLAGALNGLVDLDAKKIVVAGRELSPSERQAFHNLKIDTAIVALAKNGKFEGTPPTNLLAERFVEIYSYNIKNASKNPSDMMIKTAAQKSLKELSLEVEGKSGKRASKLKAEKTEKDSLRAELGRALRGTLVVKYTDYSEVSIEDYDNTLGKEPENYNAEMINQQKDRIKYIDSISFDKIHPAIIAVLDSMKLLDDEKKQVTTKFKSNLLIGDFAQIISDRLEMASIVSGKNYSSKVGSADYKFFEDYLKMNNIEGIENAGLYKKLANLDKETILERIKEYENQTTEEITKQQILELESNNINEKLYQIYFKNESTFNRVCNILDNLSWGCYPLDDVDSSGQREYSITINEESEIFKNYAIKELSKMYLETENMEKDLPLLNEAKRNFYTRSY